MENVTNQDNTQKDTRENTKPNKAGMTTGSRKQTHTGLLTPRGE